MKTNRPAGLSTLILMALVGAFAALWGWARPGNVALGPVAADAAGVELSLLDNGFHTDLAVPRAALEARTGPLAEAVRALPPGDWVLIGWGDAKFYVDQSPIQDRLPDGARAFFHPGNPSVVMLDPAQSDPTSTFAREGRETFRLSPEGFDRFADHIEASLALVGGRAIVTAHRPGDDARFYASREHFSIGHLCNHWTAGALNAGGIAIRPLRSTTSAEVIAAVRRAELDTGTYRD
jgi:hypothetical protein